MKTGMGLVLIGIGAILAFAVTTNTSVLNLHTAGYVSPPNRARARPTSWKTSTKPEFTNS